MFSKKLWSGIVLALVVCLNCVTATEKSGNSTVLVIPARYKVVQLAFDIVTLRSVNLISYQKVSGSSDLLLHAWNAANRVWVEITSSELQSGLFDAVAAAVIGPDGSDFINYTGSSAWGGAVKVLPTYDIAQILTGLDGCYHFRPYEWEWLARRYNLSVKDTNYEQRRYGRYGPPGSKNTKQSVGPSSYQREVRNIDVEDVEVISPIIDEVEVVEIVPVTTPAVKAKYNARKKRGGRHIGNSSNGDNMIRLHELLPEK